MRVVALLASHNRCEATLACLQSYFSQELPPSIVLQAVLVDDASIDDTAQAVRRAFPAVAVVDGTGALYWAGGMARAEQAALAFRADFLLWLNDDVVLDNDALAAPPIHRAGGRRWAMHRRRGGSRS